MVKQTTMIVTVWVLVVLFVKNFVVCWSRPCKRIHDQTPQWWRERECCGWWGRRFVFLPFLCPWFWQLYRCKISQMRLNNSCWRGLLFESVLFEKIVLSHNSIYKLKPLWLWMRNWNSLPSSSLNSIWPGLFWCIRDPGGEGAHCAPPKYLWVGWGLGSNSCWKWLA